ncbi:bacterial low temperature requirement A protein-domain-containing protein [Cokeromyces recurvatus]|uniref:bacterial low temperature requirement A protein-domain-containing protein n=1 Tax=Cokeromyces recurvatus TaxID=90255 RepID=UPI00221F32B1|nr:bacterial low temperature requirement A protein-domain-containing protein [Cokeromyces recurvatus]KAI7898703.1 bacterial low temperature requirement A protein-domain-containing protein [Cokeromyces recurvatus]
MSSQNRGFQGPSFGTDRMGRQRPSIIPTDDEEQEQQLGVIEEGGRYLNNNRSNISTRVSNRSNISHYTSTENADRRPSSAVMDSKISNSKKIHVVSPDSHISQQSKATAPYDDNNTVSPLHDPMTGKPLRRHGTELIGDVLLHPLKEYQLHQKRLEAYEAEKNVWNEKHPESIASNKDDINHINEPVVEVRTRLTLHFRHLVGDQDFTFTEDQINLLEKPLELTLEEKDKLKLFKDTDDFIDFLEKTKRNFSVKVHKTVQIRQQIANAKSELFSDSSNSSINLTENPNIVVDSNQISSDGVHTPPQKSDSGGDLTVTKAHPHINRSPDDLLIDLNNNVYIQVQFIPIIHHQHTKMRRAIFLVPDPDLSDEIGEETSATWVELLGDVFYVGWLSQFTHSVHINSIDSLNTYAAWFVVMWWTWCSSALYSSRYDRGDVAHHIYKIIELCGLILMAGSSDKEKFESSPKYFIIGYITMKAVSLFQYTVIFIVSLGAHFKSSHRPLGIYVTASAISIAMWGVSLLYTSKIDIGKRYGLWYSSIGMEMLIHVFLQGNNRVSLAASHLGERFGLFTLIILGENCMGFIKMVAEADATSSLIACNVFGVTIIFCYFFMYFDDFSGEFLSKNRLSPLWMYLHFPLHLFQVAFGIALTDIIAKHSLLQDTSTYLDSILEKCHASDPPALMTENKTIIEHYKVLSLSVESSHSTTASESCNPLFDIKIFWITAGLILCFNAFIKLVNTPVNRG